MICFSEMSSNNNSVEEFSEDEAALIARIYNLLGKRSVSLHYCVFNYSILVSSLTLLASFLFFLMSFPPFSLFRWTLIAGRIPGKTAEEIEHYFTSS